MFSPEEREVNPETTDVISEERAENLPLSGKAAFFHLFFFHNFVASLLFLHEKGL